MNARARWAPAGKAALAALLAGAWAPWALAQESLSLQRPDGQGLHATRYAPSGASCLGVAVVSHGAGGSDKGYAYLGQAMGALGYLTVVVGHPESGRQALRTQVRGTGGLRTGLAELITDPAAYRARLQDIAAAKAWAAARCGGAASVLIGHSMGAATVMLEAGARNKLGVQGSDGFQAYIALSPQGSGSIFPPHAWSDLHRPMLTLTGTRDQELGGASWETRTEPFSDMPPGCKWLGVVAGATHMHFAGHGASRHTEALTTQVIAAFLAGVQRGDCQPPPAPSGMELRAK